VLAVCRCLDVSANTHEHKADDRGWIGAQTTRETPKPG
jgi:hypothetical protein